MSTKQAFEYMISIQGKNRQGYIYDMTRPLTATKIFLAPSNYATQPAEVAEIVGQGRQFVVMESQTKRELGRPPRRGDRIEDPYLGEKMITQVRELPDLGGAVMGYRIWVE